MYTIEMVKRFVCECEVCAHRWQAELLPLRCARCKAAKWNGGKRKDKNIQVEPVNEPEPTPPPELDDIDVPEEFAPIEQQSTADPSPIFNEREIEEIEEEETSAPIVERVRKEPKPKKPAKEKKPKKQSTGKCPHGFMVVDGVTACLNCR